MMSIVVTILLVWTALGIPALIVFLACAHVGGLSDGEGDR